MLNIECWSPPDADGPSFSEADGHIQAAGGLRRNASSAALKTPPTKYARMSTFPEETGNGANGTSHRGVPKSKVEEKPLEAAPSKGLEVAPAEAAPPKGVVYDKYYHRLGFEIDSDGCSG